MRRAHVEKYLLGRLYLPLLLLAVGSPVAQGAPPSSGVDGVTLAQLSGDIVVRGQDAEAEAAAAGQEDQRRAPFLPPEPLRLVQPDYPRAARTAGNDGSVLACFTIDENGRVVAPDVRESSATVFERAVLSALSRSRFRPARIDGRPVRSTACRTWRFILEPLFPAERRSSG